MSGTSIWMGMNGGSGREHPFSFGPVLKRIILPAVIVIGFLLISSAAAASVPVSDLGNSVVLGLLSWGVPGPASLLPAEMVTTNPEVFAAVLPPAPRIYPLPVTVTASPATVIPGVRSLIRVDVRFPDGSPLQDALVTVTTDRTGATLNPASGQTAADGSFTTEFRSQEAGTFLVTAYAEWMPVTLTTLGKEYNGSGSAQVTVRAQTPSITLTPRSGPSGTDVTVTGTGFNLYGVEIPRASVFFDTINVRQDVPVQRDESGYYGSFSTEFRVPPTISLGTHTITVTGPRDTLSEMFMVTDAPPTAFMEASPLSGSAPLTVTFYAGRSADPDGTISAYRWSFGDGETGTGVQAVHTYRKPGTFQPTLEVIDDRGLSDSTFTVIKIDNSPPVAEIAAAPLSGAAPLKTTFDGSSSHDPDGEITRYSWIFGDGDTGSGRQVTHAYREPGNYQAILTLTDDAGATGSATVTISAGTRPNQLPIAIISADPADVTPPFTVKLDGRRSYDPDPDGSITAWIWDFGDGGRGTGDQVIHTYRDAGTYTVRLTVVDDREGEGSASAIIRLNTPFPWNLLVFILVGIVSAAAIVKWLMNRVPKPPTEITAVEVRGGIDGTKASPASRSGRDAVGWCIETRDGVKIGGEDRK